MIFYYLLKSIFMINNIMVTVKVEVDQRVSGCGGCSIITFTSIRFIQIIYFFFIYNEIFILLLYLSLSQVTVLQCSGVSSRRCQGEEWSPGLMTSLSESGTSPRGQVSTHCLSTLTM